MTTEAEIAKGTLERYSGSKAEDFCSYLILTNFPLYVDYFANTRGVPICKGSAFEVAHCPEEDISIIDFKMGSPLASVVVDVCSFLPLKASLLLGMCGGLRRAYEVGSYLVPVAGIRAEGTSDFYFPKEVPAMANFLVQRAVTDVLQEKDIPYHVGITYTTNVRFWEFNEEFRQNLIKSRAQCIEMECATLFTASYYRKLPLGALLLISDLPLEKKGIKTKKSSQEVFRKHTVDHVESGVEVMKKLAQFENQGLKGLSRGRKS
jgi:AMP nucleosidase